MEVAYIALGANLPSWAGQPGLTLDAAVGQLAELGRIVARSSYYVTQPVGYADQPEFLNGAVGLETALEPEELLAEMMRIEQKFGRDRSGAIENGPRTLDLDLLLFGSRVMHTETLAIPHPRMASRSFVMIPLSEIAPEVIHPILKQSVGQLSRQLQVL